MYTIIRVFKNNEDIPIAVWTTADTAEQLYNTVRDGHGGLTTASWVLENGKVVLQRLDKWMMDREDIYGK